MCNCNLVTICGVIARLEKPRFTPAGMMIAELKLNHQSSQLEAGIQRQVLCDLHVIAMADLAKRLLSFDTGHNIKVTGFLALKNRMSNQLVLHASIIEAAL
ncbi:MAG: primosomal replication protein N [Nitrosomonas sp.]|nr:primosomal replication protein N [Nitrosomonas sp.]